MEVFTEYIFDDVEPATAELDVELRNTNGLYHLLHRCYSNHFPCEIRPDDILNCVLSIWAKYVVINAEKFRDFFVEHDGKKELVYFSGGTYSDARLPEFFSGLLELIKNDQANDNMSWADHQFSTTQLDDSMLRGAALLASQKEYYEYGIMLSCGFSKVRLMGNSSDWVELIRCIVLMPEVDEFVGAWKNEVIAVITEMLNGDADFWQRCITRERGGSGPQTVEGWVKVFNPIKENGEWIGNVLDKSDVLNLTCDFEINVNDNGNVFKVEIESGPTSLKINEDGYLQVANIMEVTKKKNQESAVVA